MDLLQPAAYGLKRGLIGMDFSWPVDTWWWWWVGWVGSGPGCNPTIGRGKGEKGPYVGRYASR